MARVDNLPHNKRPGRRSTAPFIALTGAQGTGKSTLAAALKPKLDELFKADVTIVQGVGRQVKDKGFSIDKDATVESKWAIEAAYIDLEHHLRHVPKLFCRSIVDRFAYARASGLDMMDLYYNKLIQPYALEYDILLYTPIETGVPLEGDGYRNPDAEFQKKVDESVRKIIVDYDVAVQVVTGTVEQRCTTALEAIKLRLGL